MVWQGKFHFYSLLPKFVIGSISRNVKRVSFEKILNTAFQQGIVGTHFDYGTVEISTAGSEGAKLQFRAVEAPKRFRNG